MDLTEKKHTPVLAPETSLINILGVVYAHKKTSDGGDLYLTRYGLNYDRHLEIENWYEKEWFTSHREPLAGTSSVFRVQTKEVDGRQLQLVVKNCRVGEDVPIDTHTLNEFINAEFNSMFEGVKSMVSARAAGLWERAVGKSSVESTVFRGRPALMALRTNQSPK